MTASLSDALSEQFASIARFQRAAGHLYAGPTHSLESLRAAIAKADDVDTDSLREAADCAVGHEHSGVWEVGPVRWLERKAIEKTTEFAKRAVSDALRGLGVQFDEETKRRDEFLRQAKACADAVDSCLEVSEESLRDFITMPTPLLDMLAVLLKGLRTRTNARVLRTLVSAGHDLIESSHEKILQQCQDRDAQLQKYYDLLAQKSQFVCQPPEGEPHKDPPPVQEERPAPEEPEAGDKGGGEDSPAPETTPAGVEPCQPDAPVQASAATSAGGGKVAGADQPAANAGVSESCSAASPKEEVTPQQGREPNPDYPEESPAEPATRSTPPGFGLGIGSLSLPSGANFSGILGQVGAGIAVAGVGVLVAGLVGFLHDHPLDVAGMLGLNQNVPDVPVAPEVPAADGDCEVDDNGVFPPPEELSHVPEPTPPAEKVARLGHASHPASEGEPHLASMSAGVPLSGAGMDYSSVPDTNDSLHARKAGQW